MENKPLTLQKKEENKKKWIIFFRYNIHRFIEMYFGIKLYPYQWLDMYAMANNTKYAGIKSRGTAKTWEAGVFACAYAVLYPNSQITIVSEIKKQAGIIIDKKIRPLADKYINLGREIKNIKANNNDWEIEFYNGSIIFVVALKESARGNRSSFIIYEEFRKLNKEKIDAIIKPFKQPRVTPYLSNPKYKHLVEDAREIYITSSGRDSEPWWKDIEAIIKQCLRGKSAMVLFADYLIALKYNLKTQQDVYEDKQEMGDEIFSMEYENILIRENKDAFFAPSLFINSRSLKMMNYPQHMSRYIKDKNIYAPQTQKGELIIITVDAALKAGNKNDNTIIKVDKLTPTKKGYVQNLIYMESMRGKNTIIQCIRIKQIFYDFNASYIILDTNGNGIGIYDNMTEVTVDESRGITYPAMTSMFHETISKYDDYHSRTKGINALPIIYPMYATETINSDCAYKVRDLIQSDMIKFPCDPNEGELFLQEKAKYFDIKNDMPLLPWFAKPYYQASELQGEMCALKPTYSGNLVKLSEPSNGRKDRYTTLAYSTYFVYYVLNPRIVKQVEKVDYTKQIMVASGGGNQSDRFGSRSVQKSPTRKFFGR
jgi:hypothetical protein